MNMNEQEIKTSAELLKKLYPHLDLKMDKKCPACGKAIHPWASYCSDRCGAEIKRRKWRLEKIESDKEKACGQSVREREIINRDEKVLKKLDIPERFWGATVEDFQDKPGLGVEVLDWLSGVKKPFLYLQGDIDGGTGTTHLSCGLLKWAYILDGGGAFCSIPEMIIEAKSTFGFNDKSHGLLVNKYKSQKFLVLDDLGKEKAYETVKDVLWTIINYRYNHLLKTVFTSNLSTEMVAANYPEAVGGPLASRLQDGKDCRLIKLGGRDRRKAI